MHERGRVHYNDLAREVHERFGEEWIVAGVNGERLSDPVLAAVRRAHAGRIRWQAPYWYSLEGERPSVPRRTAAYA